MRVAGIMSGTSLDGIDVAIVDIAGSKIRTVAHSTIPYPKPTRNRILAVTTPAHISRLNFELGELYAKAVSSTCESAQIPLLSLDLVGCHGQTIWHEGGKNTLQIGEASVIAERLNVPVVSDFRTRDIAAGGQGAPLVPFVDVLLFSRAKRRRVALNIGGIANITIIPGGIAFDTGPGNMVIDQLVERLTHGRQCYDRNGAIAARGQVHRSLLAALLRDSYYAAPPPKTAGREQYGLAFVERFLAIDLSVEDRIATATALTSTTIARAVPTGTQELIASGGGVHNRQLMAQIAAFLPDVRVTTTAEFGIDPDAKEAIAFAILAFRTWKHRTGNLPSATGANRAVILGKLTLK
ncbi:MAG TPA: anhydro-N-acetylmuramic acid kinase [Bryobacteraceae bacterium]